MWLTHFWHSWSQFFIFAWDVTAGGILRTGVLICLVIFKLNLFLRFTQNIYLFCRLLASTSINATWVPYKCCGLVFVKRGPHQDARWFMCLQKNFGAHNTASILNYQDGKSHSSQLMVPKTVIREFRGDIYLRSDLSNARLSFLDAKTHDAMPCVLIISYVSI